MMGRGKQVLNNALLLYRCQKRRRFVFLYSSCKDMISADTLLHNLICFISDYTSLTACSTIIYHTFIVILKAKAFDLPCMLHNGS